MLIMESSVRKPVTTLLSDGLVTLDPEDSLERADMLMALAETRHWPVSSGQRLAGLISLRGLLAVGYRRGECDVLVGDAMSALPVVLEHDADLFTAAQLMANNHVTCLPIVDGPFLVGVLTSTDFVRFAVAEMRDEAEECGWSTTVDDLMTPDPITIAPDRSTYDAERIMRHGDLCHLLVTEGDRLVGLLSERDLLRGAVANFPTPGYHTVGEIMTSAPLAIGAVREAEVAGSIMIHRGVGALPVVRAERIVGILTRSDFLGFVTSRASDAKTLLLDDRPGSPG